jgi:hypothetical protein
MTVRITEVFLIRIRKLVKERFHYSTWYCCNTCICITVLVYTKYQPKTEVHSLWLGLSCWRSLRVSGPLVENLRHGVWLKELWNTDLNSLSLLVKNFVGRVRRSRIQAPGGRTKFDATRWPIIQWYLHMHVPTACIGHNSRVQYYCTLSCTRIILLVQCNTSQLARGKCSTCRPLTSAHYQLLGIQYSWYHTVRVIKFARCNVMVLFQVAGSSQHQMSVVTAFLLRDNIMKGGFAVLTTTETEVEAVVLQ